MKASQCAFNSAAALRRVFINNALGTQSSGQLVLPRILLPSLAKPQLRHAFSTHPALLKKAIQPVKIIRDNQIESPFVHLRDPQTGRLGPPTAPRDILRNLNTKEESLVVVVDPSQKSLGENSPQYPICAIVNRKAEREERYGQIMAERNARRDKKDMDKELEIRWGIAAHDMQMKLKKLRQFLDKGYRVQVTLMRNTKRGKKVATQEECMELVKAVEDVIRETPGTKEAKARSGALGGNLKITLLGTKRAEPVPVPAEETSVKPST